MAAPFITFTVGGAVVPVTVPDILAATSAANTAAEAHDDTQTWLTGMHVNNKPRLRTAVPGLMLPPGAASLAVHWLAVVNWMTAHVWPLGFIPGVGAPGGPIAIPVPASPQVFARSQWSSRTTSLRPLAWGCALPSHLSCPSAYFRAQVVRSLGMQHPSTRWAAYPCSPTSAWWLPLTCCSPHLAVHPPPGSLVSSVLWGSHWTASTPL
jgi:hypothetical protein